ncbi:hypothetical protein TUM22923_05970 [Polynucleobacter sp. TUM22923]|jgi:hypothetical protein|uniref:hypothetical protein n=1 Tax=Polynucleobacter sp. TUM22923 TaxID=3022126 RepID=UPI002573566F|nr:hypothetical protein [Polynucleobacter sp. TUM22923]BDX21276.1 hypothetical protein TUM22923_05970 [Polynucleobacter sp. TUM22923]
MLKNRFDELHARHWVQMAEAAQLGAPQLKRRVLEIAGELPDLAKGLQAHFLAIRVFVSRCFSVVFPFFAQFKSNHHHLRSKCAAVFKRLECIAGNAQLLQNVAGMLA